LRGSQKTTCIVSPPETTAIGLIVVDLIVCNRITRRLMEAAVGTSAVEKELIELENQYWQAIRERDVEAAIRLTDDPCIVTGAQGVGSINRQTYAKMMETATWQLNEFELRDLQVRLLSEDVAIVAYTVKEELTVEGKPVTLEAADASTWIRRDGEWLCALHTEAVAGDPFGRNRESGETR
jgi:hypothetical protein